MSSTLPIPCSAVLADLARILAGAGDDSKLADQAVESFLARAACEWEALLDRRYTLQDDVLDAILRDGTAEEAPLGWTHSLIGIPQRPAWVAARVILASADHLPPRLLAEAAVRVNRAKPADEDLTRLTILARHGWRLRKAASGLIASVEPDEADEAVNDRAERGE